MTHRLREAYAPHAVPNYEHLGAQFDALAAKFSATVTAVDPREGRRHQPDTTATSRSAKPAASSAATCSPYAVAARVPTIAAARSATSSRRAGPRQPQHQRRMRLWPLLRVDTGERGEGSGHSVSAAVTKRPPSRARIPKSLVAQSISCHASLTRSS